MDLLQRLQDKRDWLKATPGMKHANAPLTLADLEMILNALKPRMLGSMEPRGTKLSQEDAAKAYAEIQARASEEWVAILRAEA